MISQKEVAIKISVIMPALNEEAGIGDALKAIRDEAVSSASEVEVIVVDGGSDDKTCEVAAEFAHVMVSSERGRAVQMNAGALCATGDVLLFMHADCIVPAGVFGLMLEALDKDEVVAGAFDLKIDHDSVWARSVEWSANWRTRIFRLAYGDQGLFMTAQTFRVLGGFAQMPLMEDIEMGFRLKKMGRVFFVRSPMCASPRRWLKEGVIYTTLKDWVLAFSYYVLKISPKRLARYYGDAR